MLFRQFIIGLVLITTEVALVTMPFIPERCVACHQTECPYGIAKPLRTMSIIEWMYDNTPDLHLNFFCPNKFVLDNEARGE